MRRRFGVAGDDLDAIAVDTEMFGHDLPDNRFSALPEFSHRNQAANVAGRRDLDDGAVLR